MDISVAQEQNVSTSTASAGSKPAPKQQGTFHKNNNGKRPFNRSAKAPSKQEPPAKRQMATFSKKPETKISSTYLLQPYFEIATQFNGVQYIANTFYDILSCRDSKMTNLFTADEFYYIILMSVYYRCASVANAAKATIIFGFSDLKSMMEHVLLPDAIATYVETFGNVDLSNGITVLPYFRDIGEMTNLALFARPQVVLDRINLSREEADNLPYPIHGNWRLCPTIIVQYMKAVTRALKNAIELREVKYTELSGRPELLAIYSVEDNRQLQCKALDKLDQSQCQLGAAFRFRTSEMLAIVGEPLIPLYGAPNIDSDVVLTTHFSNSLRQKN